MTVAAAQAIDYNVTDEELKAVSAEFETERPEAVLRWAVEEFGPDVALATGFGVEGCVLIDMVSRITKGARIFYLDTDLLFPETYALRDRLEARYGIRFERRATPLSLSAQAAAFGERLWEREPDRCCHLRKVEPLREALAGLRAWITAIRREQTPARASAAIVAPDSKFGLIKINPLATWSFEDVWNYVKQYEVPYNPLHNHGYSSIGCTPCTTPVQIGEDPRAGRWRGSGKTECGLHR
ncbi:MAG TPA: phosphoadenylyl-sulfate reductase [Pyrinomonadaceae bacterium]|jgi:phosphoadenosine phosphosulfate reductase|nr:phosphoadenylyl-sulfate reductase [Pyrinomonadaceae bacterium]